MMLTLIVYMALLSPTAHAIEAEADIFKAKLSDKKEDSLTFLGYDAELGIHTSSV